MYYYYVGTYLYETRLMNPKEIVIVNNKWQQYYYHCLGLLDGKIIIRHQKFDMEW